MWGSCGVRGGTATIGEEVVQEGGEGHRLAEGRLANCWQRRMMAAPALSLALGRAHVNTKRVRFVSFCKLAIFISIIIYPRIVTQVPETSIAFIESRTGHSPITFKYFFYTTYYFAWKAKTFVQPQTSSQSG